MIPDCERWNEALHIEHIHGDEGPAFIASRVGALALKGDMAGVTGSKEIAERYDQLWPRPDDVIPRLIDGELHDGDPQENDA